MRWHWVVIQKLKNTSCLPWMGPGFEVVHLRNPLTSRAVESWWRDQMETFSALLAICARNSQVTGEFPAQRPVMRSFDVFFDQRPNKRLSKQSWGWWLETPSRPLWRQCNGVLANCLKWTGVNFNTRVKFELHTGVADYIHWHINTLFISAMFLLNTTSKNDNDHGNEFIVTIYFKCFLNKVHEDIKEYNSL